MSSLVFLTQARGESAVSLGTTVRSCGTSSFDANARTRFDGFDVDGILKRFISSRNEIKQNRECGRVKKGVPSLGVLPIMFSVSLKPARTGRTPSIVTQLFCSSLKSTGVERNFDIDHMMLLCPVRELREGAD